MSGKANLVIPVWIFKLKIVKGIDTYTVSAENKRNFVVAEGKTLKSALRKLADGLYHHLKTCEGLK